MNSVQFPRGGKIISGKTLTATLLFVLTIGAAFAQKYDPGASDTEIRLGQTIPYSGAVSASAAVGLASIAYFDDINKKGGIHGRMIRLHSVDDGYNPPKTVELTRRLIESDEVLAVYGSLGTPTNAAVQKYLNARRIPQLFIATGASRFNDPKAFPWTVPLLPNFGAEGRATARYVLSAIPDPKIAVVYQNDDFGKDYLAGFKAGLGEKAGTLIISEQSYEVTAPTIQSQIVAAKASGANVFYFVGTQNSALCRSACAMRLAGNQCLSHVAFLLGWRPCLSPPALNSLKA
ncbi:ABC transporter substrate-binding protein [Bradyrhizobium sp. 2]|uniref:ABC transporter substrate-binding protein n=1 Tax=Bradyrhizobium sp. 2 TaxID=190045 RepID=UPI002097CA6D|nr:ABC transporter substrate-binding protein [Bradyrhizobium sp. 2]MCK1465540.1 ABC transporter substrate-binding protein [Bradyrhizobium sp. 2]